MQKQDKRLKAKRKAPVPMFSKDENNPSEKASEEMKIKEEELAYSEKFKPLREDPGYLKMKEKQEKAESDLKEWKKQKVDTHKRTTSKKASRKNKEQSTEEMPLKNKNSKGGKNSSFYQAGKAIVFQ
mmetsp:Transcript_34975/g.40418  ORF Transcript_34975/g.40418 Transcript_34975/m.40418 type:complete len:127 (+) Transcript_34975:462-842(+)